MSNDLTQINNLLEEDSKEKLELLHEARPSATRAKIVFVFTGAANATANEVQQRLEIVASEIKALRNLNGAFFFVQGGRHQVRRFDTKFGKNRYGGRISCTLKKSVPAMAIDIQKITEPVINAVCTIDLGSIPTKGTRQKRTKPDKVPLYKNTPIQQLTIS